MSLAIDAYIFPSLFGGATLNSLTSFICSIRWGGKYFFNSSLLDFDLNFSAAAYVLELEGPSFFLLFLLIRQI